MKTIYINATLTDSELKALMTHVEALEELKNLVEQIEVKS